MNNIHYITSKILDFETLSELILTEKKVKLSKEAIVKIESCRTYLDKKTNSNTTPIYGINTGFGSLYNIKIDTKNLQQLQENLVMSHACGIGKKVPKSIVKLMLLLKIQSLSYGYSGVQVETVKRLVDFYNNNITPIIYTQGSLGASGDLAPLAHLFLPLFGEGEFWMDEEIIPAKEILKKHNLSPIQLNAKEGLALINGTQFILAHAIVGLRKMEYLLDLATT